MIPITQCHIITWSQTTPALLEKRFSTFSCGFVEMGSCHLSSVSEDMNGCMKCSMKKKRTLTSPGQTKKTLLLREGGGPSQELRSPHWAGGSLRLRGTDAAQSRQIWPLTSYVKATEKLYLITQVLNIWWLIRCPLGSVGVEVR